MAPSSSRQHFIVASNLPVDGTTSRSSRTPNWKSLKDVVRSNISDDRQPGYTNVMGGNGWCSLKSANDAYLAYTGLVNSDDFGQQLLVHLYAISGSGHEKEAKLIDCNCSDYFNIRGDHSEDKSRAKMILDYGILYWQTKDSSNNHVDVSSLTSETSRLAVSDTPSSYYDNIAVQPYYQTAYPSPPMQYETPSSPQYDNGHYHTNGDGTPINNSHGLVQTTKRSVHVANMSKRTKKKEMISLLQKYGVANYSDLDFHTDPTGRVTKGTAIIHYRHVSDAYKAEKELHGRSLNGRAIRAKRAKETVMVDSLEPSRPPVVNGSYGY